MNRNRIHILIVDDEATQGKALEAAFKRIGYSATWCNTSVGALTLAQRQEFHCLIVDCLLPKMNGIDLAEEILNLAPRKPKVFFYSGIYKDRNFMREALDRVPAEDFMTKPLDLEQLIGRVDHLFAKDLEEKIEPALMPLYARNPLDDDQWRAFLEPGPTIHAFHMPILLRALQKSNLSGELTMITAEGDMNSINIYDGRVFSVRTPDRESFFGAIAVGFGFVTPEEVLSALQGPTKKLLGQKLIESHSLSPHAINVILEEQLALRLSQCVQNAVVTLQWNSQNYGTPEFSLNPSRLDGLIDDWIHSKIDLEWIRTALTEWGAYKIEGDYHQKLKDPMTFTELLVAEEFFEQDDLPHVFRQLLYGEAWFSGRAQADNDYGFLEARLEQMLKDHKAQNYFQILGVGEKARAQEVNKAYGDLCAVFDPKVLKEDCPARVRTKCIKVFAGISNAYDTLSDDFKRSKYLIVLQNKRSQRLYENEPIFHAAVLELQHGHYQEAARKFQSLLDAKLEFKDLRSYRIWAGLKAERGYGAMTLEQVPPEERHSAVYMMATGVSYRAKGALQKALHSFRTAHVLDPRLSIAKAELENLAEYLEKNRGNKDLVKEVAGVLDTLFGRNRRGA